MNSSNTIFLKPGDHVILDGVEMSYEEIRESKIDSIILKKIMAKSTE